MLVVSELYYKGHQFAQKCHCCHCRQCVQKYGRSCVITFLAYSVIEQSASFGAWKHH